jgi:tetratricopeptide (TPR) repeat protein
MIKRTILLFLISFFVLVSTAQTAEEVFNKGTAAEKAENYQEALHCYQKAYKIAAMNSRPNNELSSCLLNAGRAAYIMEDYSTAAKYFEKALPLTEKFGKLYEKMLDWLGKCYMETNDVKNQERIMTLVEEHNQHELTKPCDEPECMLERAQYFTAKGESTKAKENYLKVLDMPMEDKMKVKVYTTYAQFLSGNMEDWVQSGEYFQMAAKAEKKANGENDSYANLMYRAGLCLYVGKEYTKSAESHRLALCYYQKDETKEHQQKAALCLKGLGNAYKALHDYEHAKPAFQKLIDYYAANDAGSKDYPKALESLAVSEKFNKEYDASIEHYKKAIALYDKLDMVQEKANAESGLNLCYLYAKKSDRVAVNENAYLTAANAKTDSIVKYELAHLEMTRKYGGEIGYATSLSTIAGSYSLLGDYENAEKYYHLYVPALRDAMREAFRMRSTQERMLLWEKHKKNVSELLETTALLYENNNPHAKNFADLAYDAELLSKGILLNSAIEFEKVLASYPDASLKQKYAHIKINEQEVERLSSTGTKDNLEIALELKRKNQELELELYKGCAEYADFTDYMSYDWHDVQKVLQLGDIAIEFAAIKTNVFDKNNYIYALVLNKEMPQPEVITVCSYQETKDMAADVTLFDRMDDGNPIWGKLCVYLQGCKRLFFSADGALQSLAIEYLPFNGKTLSEQMEVYRLSSTKELCYHHKREGIEYAALFGDIDYNEGATVSPQTERSLDAMRGVGGDGGSMFADLSNTLIEVQNIQSILKGKNLKNIGLFIGTEASENAFKRLSGSKVNLLHVATHGTFTNMKNATDAQAMENSKLAFAGANLGGDAADNGIITATDVSQMDLRQCDMVVLSACETGLGKLGSDGVFGLQRGFKNAGVHTILMSLKNVNDASTAMLMSNFYQNIANGSSKREALLNAQQYLCGKGYKDGKYWASFIILDGYGN